MSLYAKARLTNYEGTNYSPNWSPDGGQIKFRSKRGGDFDIYVMDADGSDVTRLTIHRADDYYPVW